MQSSIYLIQQMKESSIASERKLATFIIDHPNQVISMSITEVAGKAGTSTAAIIRLCKKLNFKGFPELRMEIAKEFFSKKYPHKTESKTVLDYDGESSVSDIVSNMIDVVGNAICNIDKLIDRQNVEKAVLKLKQARSILLAGTGASGIVGRDFHQKLSRLGYLSNYTEDSELQTIAACSMTIDDVVVAISYSGEKKTLIRTVQQAKQNRACIIAITRFKPTTLAKLADIVLYIPDLETLYREGGALISRICQLVVVDMLFSALIASDFDHSVQLLDKTWRAIDHEIKD